MCGIRGIPGIPGILGIISATFIHCVITCMLKIIQPFLSLDHCTGMYVSNQFLDRSKPCHPVHLCHSRPNSSASDKILIFFLARNSHSFLSDDVDGIFARVSLLGFALMFFLKSETPLSFA